jgi:formylglycine-generating enzyme required for sulfatase activity
MTAGFELVKMIRTLFAVLLALAGLLQEGASQVAQPDLSRMVLIPAGEFWMGQTQVWIRDALEWTERDRLDAVPAHLVYLDAYYFDKYEVTNEGYARFADATGRRKPWHWTGGKFPDSKDKMPVYNVNWADAHAYCSWAGLRLPTEAEWEKAARGGLDRKLYPWGDEFGPKPGGRFGDGRVQTGEKKAHYSFPDGPAKVGSYPPNGYGLFDGTGNVWEWTADWYGRNYYSESPEKNPAGPESGVYRVIRGASWGDAERTPTMSVMSLHFRNYTDPDSHAATVGFRCAKSQ